jgi:hypothetical protein
VVRVHWELAGSPRLRWPLPSPQGLTGALFWVGGSPAPGPRLACQDARARDWYSSADQTGNGSDVSAGSAARIPRRCRDTGQTVQHEDSRMKPAAGSPTQEALAGFVERVTFHNAENGFCLLRTKARGHRELVTVVGHSATIAAGEWITATGEWVNDRTHGQQFKARFLRTSVFTCGRSRVVYCHPVQDQSVIGPLRFRGRPSWFGGAAPQMSGPLWRPRRRPCVDDRGARSRN